MLLLSLTKKYENLVQTLMRMGDTLTMDEIRKSLLAYDLRKVSNSGMSSNGREGRESNEQAQGLFVTRGRTNERGNSRHKKSRSKSRVPMERASYKCGELGHIKANSPNKMVLFMKQTNNDNGGKQPDLSTSEQDQKLFVAHWL